MPSQTHSQHLFDLFSFARRGPGRRDHLSPGEIQQVARTVRRTPEVMVKVLPKSANNVAAVRKHLGYIGRRGALDLETDDGDQLRGTHVGKDLLEDWDLELDEYRRKADLTGTRGREAARLVHKMIFSMPAGTPPQKVLAAVRNFAREEFAFKHRYVMALHTDTPRPHVHFVIKAISEQGQRLHIRKTILRNWRTKFASHLQAVGVSANATPRHFRGETSLNKADAIYRPSLRGESTYIRDRAERVALELANGGLRVERAKLQMVATRKMVEGAWAEVTDLLFRSGNPELAATAQRFVEQMPPTRTEKEWLATELIERTSNFRWRKAPTR